MMTVSDGRARQEAQGWLDANQPGSTAEALGQFYNYYTLRILKDGKVTGMLSVNGFTGQIWHHTWHGAFVRTSEVSTSPPTARRPPDGATDARTTRRVAPSTAA